MFFTFEFLCLSYFVSFVFCFYSIYAVCIRRSTDETSNTKNTVTHQWATKWPSSTFLKLKVTQTRYGGIYGVQIGDSHCAHLIDEKDWGTYNFLAPLTTERWWTSALRLNCLINVQPYFYKKLGSPVNKTLKKSITVIKQMNYLNHSSGTYIR